MSRANLAFRTVSTVVLISLGACASTSGAAENAREIDAYKQAIEAASAPATPEQIATAERSDPLTRANFWAEEYRKDAGNLQTTILFMRALRGIGSHERVQEVATTALPIHPNSYELFLELGRSLMAEQKPREAVPVFVRSADLAPQTEAAPLAALGVAFDQLEDHINAQEAYTYALERDPNRTSTLSNYGLSLALSGDLKAAEAQLRKAVALPGADVRVRQNLALIFGLQGRFDDMVAVDPNAPRRTIEANREALRKMMIPARDYSTIVDDRPLTTPDAASEPMPDVREADVSAEEMPALAAEPIETADAKPLSGGPEKVVPLRPKLRGAQDG